MVQHVTEQKCEGSIGQSLLQHASDGPIGIYHSYNKIKQESDCVSVCERGCWQRLCTLQYEAKLHEAALLNDRKVVLPRAGHVGAQGMR